MAPKVSVIIPTYGRPQLLRRALVSALNQTEADIEVIVVVDGPDDATARCLRDVPDQRIRVTLLPHRVGGAEARNLGVRESRAEWVAFLDDDDEWLPNKLALQLQAARECPDLFPVVACLVKARSPLTDYIWPRRLPRTAEPLSEYLMCRRTLFQGEGLVQTTMLLVPRGLLMRVPFRGDLHRHQEWDWLLRASAVEGFALIFVSQPLAIWYVEDRRPRISTFTNWRYSLAWIQGNRTRVTPRAYAGFVLTLVASLAAAERDWRAFPHLLSEAYRHGSPRLLDLALYAGMWLVPRGVRQRLRALLHGVRVQ